MSPTRNLCLDNEEKSLSGKESEELEVPRVAEGRNQDKRKKKGTLPPLERTLIIIKPDAIHRRAIGKIISRFEEKGLRIAALKMTWLSRSQAESLYEQHKGKHFYEPLLRFVTSSPVVLLILEAKDACEVARRMLGSTSASEALPGTLRGDFGLSNRFNLVHGSDSTARAEKEINLFFRPEEVFDYEMSDFGWVYDSSTGEIV